MRAREVLKREGDRNQSLLCDSFGCICLLLFLTPVSLYTVDSRYLDFAYLE